MTTESFMTRRYCRSDRIVFRQIAGEGILVPVSSQVADLRSIYRLSTTAAAIWSRLDGSRTAGEIVDQIASEFDGVRDEVACDVEDFISMLLSEGLAGCADSEGIGACA